ncbi:MAG TPA: hypothetical protein GX736_02340 [Mogibacterium sp.]|nr:hypothetical protein [Mogibacterium sp.]
MIIADVGINSKAYGSVTETKDGRVCVTTVLGYERWNYQNIPYVKGRYYGGKVNYKQAAAKVKKIKGTYHEAGPFVTKSGSYGFSDGYTTSKSFNLANYMTLQTQTLNRTGYFNVFSGSGRVTTRFTAKYTIGGSSYTISVYASVA